MSQRGNNRQVAKRQRIRKATLIVGVDIGKTFNAVGFMDKEGNVLCSCAKLYNSREGFEEFINLIEGLKAKRHLSDFSERTAPIPIFIVAVVCGAPFASLYTGENIFIVCFFSIFFLAPFHPNLSPVLAIVTRFTRQMC
jgi:hypothetical protein